MKRPGLELLEAVAPILESLDVVYVGGSTVPTYGDGVAVLDRVTRDVDAVVAVAGYAGASALNAKLRELGLSHDTSPKAPACRWLTDSGHMVDVVTTHDSFVQSNQWYELGVETAEAITLPNGQQIRRLAPEVFILTKLSAWEGRGKGDWQASQDLEDVVSVALATSDLEARLLALPREALVFYIGALLQVMQKAALFEVLVTHSHGELHDTPRMHRAEAALLAPIRATQNEWA